MKKLKYLFYILFLFAGVFVGFLAFMTLNDYTPSKIEEICSSNQSKVIDVNEPVNCLTWNIGYAGLDANMDFFYDGGTQVRPSEHQSYHNLRAITDYVASKSKESSFIFVQEIDSAAKRSYGFNQVDTIKHKLGWQSYFGKNYSVAWVPLPIYSPMGYVESGVALFSPYQAAKVCRHAFPVNFEWPLKVFMLDRCFLSARYPTSNGRELVVIVTHNSAFDDGGELRKAELVYFKNFLEEEYKKGNYVIAGGDFNQCPARYKPNPNDKLFDYEDFHTIPDSLFPSNWNFVYENGIPTNRRVIAPYNKETTKTTLIDFFITSPNVTAKSVKCDDLHFAVSDHNPVQASFILEH